MHYNEPGIFLSFEETEEELLKDLASLNLDLRRLVLQKKILLEHIVLERRDIQELDFNLEGLLIRLEHAIAFCATKKVRATTRCKLQGVSCGLPAPARIIPSAALRIRRDHQSFRF